MSFFFVITIHKFGVSSAQWSIGMLSWINQNFAIKNLMIVGGKVYLTFIPIAFELESPSFAIPKILNKS